MHEFHTTCNIKSMGQFSTWYMTICHGTSGHVAEQSMSFNGGKTIVQKVVKLSKQGTLGHAVTQ